MNSTAECTPCQTTSGYSCQNKACMASTATVMLLARVAALVWMSEAAGTLPIFPCQCACLSMARKTKSCGQKHTHQPGETQTRSGSDCIVQKLILHKAIVLFDLDPLELPIGSKVLFQMPLMCGVWVKIDYKQSVCGCAVLPSLLFSPFCLTITLNSQAS